MNMENPHDLAKAMLQNSSIVWIPISATHGFRTLWGFHMGCLSEHSRNNWLHLQISGKELKIS